MQRCTLSAVVAPYLTPDGDTAAECFDCVGYPLREGVQLIAQIDDVVSPSFIARLDLQEGIFRAQIPDWRAVVDCVLIDVAHDGSVFNVSLADVPERKKDLVSGRYELAAPATGSSVAVKVIDMLGEERVVVLAV